MGIASHLTNIELALRTWRVIILCVGAFNIGLVGYIAWAYTSGKIAPRQPYSQRKYHILSIATSYLILMSGLWYFIFDRAVNGLGITWRLPLASIAFPLGTYGLIQLLFGVSKHDSR